MEARICDGDDTADLLASLAAAGSSASASASAPYFSHSYTDHFPLYDDGDGLGQQVDDGSSDEDRRRRKFSLDEDTTSADTAATRPPKIFDRFYDSSSDGEEDFYSSRSSSSGGPDKGNCSSSVFKNAGKRLDYMIQFLDRKLSSSDDRDAVDNQSLPEFVASGGDTGIFRVPVRAAVHPGRPPSLELRPHPLRETQRGRFLRAIVCTEDGLGHHQQLWAGSECGVRIWNLSDIYGPGMEGPPIGDEEAAPFTELVGSSPTLCLIVDEGNRVVWSGHRDGRIRCWKMDQGLDDGVPFKECLSWQAHRGPVLSIVMTSYGDLWSGSQGGVIRIWPSEAIEKSLSLTREERHMAASLVARSYIDLRNQFTVNGVSYSIFAEDVKYILSDHSGARVWTAGYLSFALWDARVRELLKAFNIDGQIENLSMVHDPMIEDEFKVGVISGTKKEKVQGSFSFFQRSRNAIMGAADAVRRVAVKGGFGDDNRRTEALIATIDGMIWTGCPNGLLVRWDGNGNRLHEVSYHPYAVQCLCAFGSRIWVGYVSGTVQVLDLSGTLLGEWLAHNSPVISMAAGAGYVFTLANHGGVRGWSLASPGLLDSILRSELAGKEFVYTRIENLKILAGTWNVGQGRATYDSLISWLGCAATDVDVVVVGLQEVEMGAGFLAMSAAKETMQVGLEGTSVGQWWLDLIGKTLDEGSTFERIGSRQLAGLLIAVWVRNNIRSHVGDVDVAAVPCGFGRAIGNKGAVGIRMRVYSRIMCFVNCHFAAHLEAVNRRNADFDHVYRTMMFSRPSNFFNVAAAAASSAIQLLRGTNTSGIHSMEGTPELSEADMVVFLGDFNYRLDGISYDEARDFVSQRYFDWLREKDQLQVEMKAGNVFQGMREAVIKFPPTYKFERHQAGLAGYDSGEKKRIPAWCDRILYRDSRAATISACSLDCPVVSSILQYEACMDVTDSDHKPVRCIFNVEIARVDETVRRQEFGEAVRSNEKISHILKGLSKVPEAIVSTNNIILQNQDVSVLRITNKCGKDKALFQIVCEGQLTLTKDGQASDYRPLGSFGFPRWLGVSPAAGIIEPDHIAEISVHHEEHQTFEEFVDGVPQNCWCEDNRDKEVILIVKVRGSCSTEAKSHRIHVCHCFPSKPKSMDHKPDNSGPIHSNLLHRADIQWSSCSSDVLDQLRNLHTP